MAAAKKKAQQEYGAQSITILEGLEAVRKRPGMYIGSTGERGLHHLVWEVVDNAVDEAMAGYAARVDVKLLEDGGVEVTDDGRGIPVAMHASGIPTVDVVMTQLHAGGKFDAEHGPMRCREACTASVSPWSTRCPSGSKSRSAAATSGRSTTTIPSRAPETGRGHQKTGTTVGIGPTTIFETTTYDFETVARRLQEMAFLNKADHHAGRRAGDRRRGGRRGCQRYRRSTRSAEEAPRPPVRTR